MEKLIQQINDAFAGLPRPTDDELLHPDCSDDVDILEFYGGVLRENMTDALVVHSYAAPTAFSPKAFQYYLPAYLIWLLNNPDSMDYAGEATLLALDPATDKEMLHAFRKSKFSLMTGAQVSVIRDFLHRLAKHPDLGELAENALINYWLDASGT